MYNTDLPTRAELPSSKQLLRSTGIAMAVAAALLVSVVMPSEYGIDPTGVGSALGLKEMGEIKQSLAAEAAQDALASTTPQVALAAPVATAASIVQPAPAEPPTQATPTAPPLTPAPPKSPTLATKADQMQVTLKPGEAAEIKLDMRKGATVNYSWSTKGGPVNVDAHGDPYDAPKGFYHGYGKGRQINGKDGVLEAAFDGKHGWFWRNRSKGTVTITLKTDGDYQSIKRVV